MTEDQMKETGLLIEKPARLEETGQEQEIYYNPVTQKCFYEYGENKSVQEQSIQEQINSLGQQLALEKIKNIQKDSVINGLGQQLANVKLQIIKLGGIN